MRKPVFKGSVLDFIENSAQSPGARISSTGNLEGFIFILTPEIRTSKYNVTSNESLQHKSDLILFLWRPTIYQKIYRIRDMGDPKEM